MSSVSFSPIVSIYSNRWSFNGGLRYDWDRLNFTDEIDPTLSGIKDLQPREPKGRTRVYAG